MKHYFPEIACILFAAIGLFVIVVAGKAAFIGEIHIALNTAERIAVHPSSVGSAMGAKGTDTRQFGVPGKNIPFNDPVNAREWIDPNVLYDVAILPFAVALGDGLELAPQQVHGTLKVSEEGRTQTYRTVPGTKVLISGEEYTIQRVSPWSGLASAPGNPPMVALALWHDDGEVMDDLFVPSGTWVRQDETIALHVEWVDTLDAARTAAAHLIAPGTIARWGVENSDHMDWLTTFQPGSGLALQDGATVTLMRWDPTHAFDSGNAPGIEVELDHAGTTKRQWLRVNEVLPQFPVRYEDLSELPTVVQVYAWEPGKAYLCVKHNGSTAGESVVSMGEEWTCADANLVVRVDDAQPAAVAVHPEDSTLFEAVLHREGRLLRVPEHRPLTLSTATLTFDAKVIPASVRYTLALYEQGGKAPFTATLGPAERVVVRGWELRQHPSRDTGVRMADITVRNQSADRYWYAGMIAMVIGLLGVGWRLGRRR